MPPKNCAIFDCKNIYFIGILFHSIYNIDKNLAVQSSCLCTSTWISAQTETLISTTYAISFKVKFYDMFGVKMGLGSHAE